MFLRKFLSDKKRRRAAVAVTTVVMLPVMVGFAALTVDVGVIYNARIDLQCAADAASLAAAAALTDVAATESPAEAMQYARSEAEKYAGMNRVLGRTLALDTEDIEFGRAYLNEDGNGYYFVPTNTLPDSIRVRTRMSEDSPNGPVPLFFAGIFGRQATDVSAFSTATIAPRDIAIVADLSASHNDDSELRNMELTTINMHQMWDALPGGADEFDGGLWDLGDIPPEWVEPDGSIPQAAGPGWGYMKDLGFGDLTINSDYDPESDDGLIRLPYNSNWTDVDLRLSLLDRGYNMTEANAIVSRTYDSSGAYEYRTAVALGLAEWNSGISGGRWQVMGLPSEGNGNSFVSSGETDFTQTIFDYNLNSSRSIWLDYIDNYVRSSSTQMYDANRDFRYRFGIKTFINYLLERRPTNEDTPEFASVPQQPMQAIKDATQYLTGLLDGVGSNDLLSLEVYGTTARHEIDLTDDFLSISEHLNSLQAGHYDQNTNMGGGMQRAIEELTSERARQASRKMMILLTDGLANINEYGGFSYNGGAEYAVDMAYAAADRGIRIFTVSVGAGADTDLMEQIAEIGGGVHFHAAGSIEDYSDQLRQIFMTIGGLKSVQLIQ